MSNAITTVERRGPGRPAGKHPRKRILLPSGDELVMREDLAEVLNVSKRSITRMRLPTTYLSNIAYHPLNECLNIVAGRIRRPQQEPPSAKQKKRRR